LLAHDRRRRSSRIHFHTKGAGASPTSARQQSVNAGHATRVLLEQSACAQIVEDVSQIVRAAPFVARTPLRFFTPGLASELAEAVDILACKVADLKEAEGANR
jgi:hypothetical protein